MYRYEYETVRCEPDGWGFIAGIIIETGEYRSIISKRAAAGWRYVGYLPTIQRGTGHVQELDLIFEKET